MNLNHLFMVFLFSALAVVAYAAQDWQYVPTAVDTLAWSVKGSERADKLDTTESLIDFILAHPEKASIAAYRVGQSEEGVFFQADRKQPLASTMKILVLAEYARQVSLELIDPEELIYLSEIEFFYLPATDGGAHPLAVKYFRENGVVDFSGRVALKQVVFAMIRFSDNAATDYVITKLGRKNIEAIPEILGLPNEAAPLPISGLFLSWMNGQLKASPKQRFTDYQAMSNTQYADEVYFWMFQLLKDEDFKRAEKERLQTSGLGLSSKDQQMFSDTFAPKGTARGYANIMARVYSGQLISPTVSGIMREFLSWPMRSETMTGQFDALGTKSGALPGTLTATYFAQPKDAEHGIVLSVFYQQLEGAVWLKLARNFMQQQLEFQWLQDEHFIERLNERLNTLNSQ